MPKGLSAAELAAEWNDLPKDWYSIYQWKRTSRKSYTEQVASLILESFDDIQLVTFKLRQSRFHLKDHRGQIQLQTDISQLTEKRLLRGMFNAGQVGPLGDVIDYEVPLGAVEDAPHGDIDLLCRNDNVVFVVEAKQPSSTESLLKGIVQAFVYTSLAATVRKPLFSNYEFSQEDVLTPGFLTFRDSQSADQLRNIDEYPQLVQLIGRIDERLEENALRPLRFFVVENDESDLKDCLIAATTQNGDVRAVFRDGFTPTIVERHIQ